MSRPVKIRTDFGTAEPAAVVYRRGGLAVVYYAETYSITHVASGRRIGPEWEDRGDAEQTLRQLLRLPIVWTNRAESASDLMTPTQLASVRRILGGDLVDQRGAFLGKRVIR